MQKWGLLHGLISTSFENRQRSIFTLVEIKRRVEHSADLYIHKNLLNEMSYRELRNLAEMMRSLGYPRPISVENFRTPNFELVSDLLYWMVKKYDPSCNVTGEIDTEEDRVEFVTQVTSEVLFKARIRLNPKKLYAADGFAVKELIRLADTLYRASRISTVTPQGVYDDEDEVSIKSIVASRVKDPKATRQLSHDLMQSGVKLYDLLEAELDIRTSRQSALRFLDALGNNGDNSIEERHLERSVKEIVNDTQKSVEITERQVIELEAEEKALTAKIKKAQVDLERSEKRLRSLQNVRPAFMDEYEKLEKELERQYAVCLDLTSLIMGLNLFIMLRFIVSDFETWTICNGSWIYITPGN